MSLLKIGMAESSFINLTADGQEIVKRHFSPLFHVSDVQTKAKDSQNNQRRGNRAH